MQVLTVSQFVTYVNDTFKAIWDPTLVALEGEVSEFRVSQGQWVNFNLKDGDALVSVFMVLGKLNLPLADGMRVRLFGFPRIYPKYGKFSFSADRVELVGEGALQKALAMLRTKLEAEGLFDPSRKRPLVRFPQRIALVASRESAAYGDFIRIVEERWRGIEIDLYHAVVQGEKAPDSVVNGIERAQKNGPYDAIVITRGGGSLEELMAFNDERVVRAVYASRFPVLAAIGHERDTTLVEEAADVRGSTPTDAARRLVPDRRDVLYEIANLEQGIGESLLQKIEAGREIIERATDGAERWIEAFRNRVAALLRLVSSFNPEAILKRGFAIVRDAEGNILSTIAKLKPGMQVAINLRDGEAGAMIEGKQGRLI